MASAPLTLAAVIGAFVYLQATSLFNSLRQRVRRLRQPKYLLGAIAGGAYLYFFLFRRLLHLGISPSSAVGGVSAQLASQLSGLAALALFVIVVLAWLIPSNRAALKFSEAEVAFLFPAPLSRRTLIQFSLLRPQIGIFVSAFVMSLVLQRGSLLGGSAWQHAAGMWLILSILNLHFLGASFTRERLLDLGIRPLLRRFVIGIALLAMALVSWWQLRTHVALPAASDFANAAAFWNYVGSVLGAPPLSWVLIPFKATVAAFFAPNTTVFLRAALPAAALLVAHYFWVLQSQISFEEASIDLARKRGERITAMREGKGRLRNAPTKARSAPFKLAAQGFKPIAFLWKGLIAMGPFWRLRTWVVACVILIAGCQWLAANPDRKQLLVIVGVCCMMLGPWLLVLGPMTMQRGMRQTLEQMDILKASPLRGRQIVLGELLTPMVVMTFSLWFLLIGAHESFGTLANGRLDVTPYLSPGLIAIALLAPPLCGLMMCVPFAGFVYFPAWTVSASTSRGGIEAMGQRMIFLAGYLLTLIVVLIPALLLGGLAFLVMKWLVALSATLLTTGLIAGATLALELVIAVEWLGRRVDRFDVSQELR